MRTISFSLWQLLRPKHWVKNVLIALPPVLAGKLSLHEIPTNLLLGILSFSLMASAGYILNDIRDIERDRAHPRKMFRPLAAAAVPVQHALLLALLLIGISIAISVYLGTQALMCIALYFALNYAYSTFLKGISYFDIIILSSFYLLRLFYGSFLTEAELTGWFLATTTMAFLTLSTHKRYMECIISKHEKIPGRGYEKSDAGMLQLFSAVFAVDTLVLLNMHAFFVLHIESPVFFGLINLFSAGMIFAYFDQRRNDSDDPVERVLKNPLLLIMTVLFIGVYAWEVMNRT